MSSAIEDPAKTLPPASKPEADTAEGWMGRVAESRLEVYPPERIRKTARAGRPGEEVEYIGSDGDREFANKLTRAGMPAGAAQLFIQLLWRCGADFSRGVSANNLAGDVGRGRTSAARGLADFEKWGIARKVVPREFPIKWEFPVHEILMQLVETYFGNKVQQKCRDAVPDKSVTSGSVSVT
jgi:hypothetical protein